MSVFTTGGREPTTDALGRNGIRWRPPEDAAMPETLLTMADEVRGKTLRLLDGVPPELVHFTAGLSNSTLWHAGHALMLVEHLCIMPATGAAPQYPAGWFEMFAWRSQP